MPSRDRPPSGLLERVGRYYADSFRRFGCTAAGVDWPSAESQRRRFQELLRVTNGSGAFSLNEYGAGFGALADYLHEERIPSVYRGLELVPEMVEAATARHAQGCGCRFVGNRDELGPADYTVASGVLHVKLDLPLAEWTSYVRVVIAELASLSVTGFAFNLLSTQVEPERRRPHLYYADPVEVSTFCIDHFSRQVTVLDDYWPHEFSILVRLSDG